MVERYLVGWSEAEVHELLARTAELAPQMAEVGVRHMASVFIPTDETCLCLFDAPDQACVQAANVAHDLPFGRVVSGELILAVA